MAGASLVVYDGGASGAAALTAFGPYFTGAYETPWGKAINYDDEWCDPVREWVCQSAEYWVGEVGLDGVEVGLGGLQPVGGLGDLGRVVGDLRLEIGGALDQRGGQRGI